MTVESPLQVVVHDSRPLITILNKHAKLCEISTIIISFLLSDVTVIRENKRDIRFKYLYELPAKKMSALLESQFIVNRKCSFLQTTSSAVATTLEQFKSAQKYTVYSGNKYVTKHFVGNNNPNFVFAVQDDQILFQIKRTFRGETIYLIGDSHRTLSWTHTKIPGLNPLQIIKVSGNQICCKELTISYTNVNHSQSFPDPSDSVGLTRIEGCWVEYLATISISSCRD
eukprot:172550_1